MPLNESAYRNSLGYERIPRLLLKSVPAVIWMVVNARDRLVKKLNLWIKETEAPRLERIPNCVAVG